MKTIRIKLYRFDELSPIAKRYAIDRRIRDMVEYEGSDHYDNWPEFKRAVDKAEAMYTPWFTDSYVWDYCGKDIVNSLTEDKESKYTKDGKLF